MEDNLPLETRLNLATAPVQWAEIARFFARGRVLAVHSSLDLVTVATALAKDDLAQFAQWTEAQQVQHLPDNTAKQWVIDDSRLWAVVVAPWVLVQKRLV